MPSSLSKRAGESSASLTLLIWEATESGDLLSTRGLAHVSRSIPLSAKLRPALDRGTSRCIPQRVGSTPSMNSQAP